jgi:uncharacterized protein (TIGR02453 family)
MPRDGNARFTLSSIEFLTELRDDNNRDWFNANKTRYEEEVLDVALRFIQAMQAPMEEIALRFTAIPKRMSGSLMRVYCDTRFSKNKTPYKTNIGIQFRHQQARDVTLRAITSTLIRMTCFLALVCGGLHRML